MVNYIDAIVNQPGAGAEKDLQSFNRALLELRTGSRRDSEL